MTGFELTIFDAPGAAERNDPLHPLATQTLEKSRNSRGSIKISKQASKGVACSNFAPFVQKARQRSQTILLSSRAFLLPRGMLSTSHGDLTVYVSHTFDIQNRG